MTVETALAGLLVILAVFAFILPAALTWSTRRSARPAPEDEPGE